MIAARVPLVIAVFVVATLGTTGVAPTLRAENWQPRVSNQLAQANHWLVGTWVWSSEWGPVIFSISGVGPGGRPIGKIENRHWNWFRSCDEKASAATVVCTISGTNVQIQFDNARYQLSQQGNALVGKYISGNSRYSRDNVQFVKR